MYFCFLSTALPSCDEYSDFRPNYDRILLNQNVFSYTSTNVSMETHRAGKPYTLEVTGIKFHLPENPVFQEYHSGKALYVVSL